MEVFVQTYGKEIVALLVPFIAWALGRYFKSSVKLISASPHSFTFLVNRPLIGPNGQQISPTQNVHTRSLVFFNDGREVATKVELVFNYKPQCINLWPSRHFTEHVEADGRYVIILDSLAPKEWLGAELLSVHDPVPNIVTVRCDQSVAQVINMYPQPVVQQSRRRAIQFLSLAGLGLVVYTLLVLLQWLILQTPLGR